MSRELAEKILVALAPLREGTPAEVASEAWALALAFDRESMKPAPVPSLADADWRDKAKPAAPSRPEWVRITGLNGDAPGTGITVGKAYKVVRWHHDGSPTVVGDDGDKCALCADSDPRSESNDELPTWEPCAAPSPAASPAPYVPTPAKAGAAAYVPKVGDVVRTTEEPTTDKWDGTLVVLKDGFVGMGGTPHIDAIRTDMDHTRTIGGDYIASMCTYLRPATAAERAAAGLDAPNEPVAGDSRPASGQVDREGLEKAMESAYAAWVDNSSDKRRLLHVYADAAIAFMAKGPAFDRAEFNEAQERDAAMDAYRAGTDGRIDPEGTNYPTCRDSFRNGWLARARVAAKGGAS